MAPGVEFHQFVSLKVGNSGETTLGNIASYYCEPGFDLIGHHNRAFGTDGTWSGVPPICQPKGR